MGPLVDVICSAKNAGERFAATIDSVLAQSFQDLRMIVIDDGSSDGWTTRLAEEAAARDRRVILHRNVVSRGLTANLVRSVADSDAEYIARIDAGDLWRPEKLEKQIAAMREDETIVVLGTQCDYVSTDRKPLGRSRFGETDEALRRAIRRRRGILSHPSIVFRRVINYRAEFVYSQDLDLYLRASQVGRLRCLGEALTVCLIDKNGVSFTYDYLQRKYGALAYRSYYSRTRRGKDVDFRITEGRLERTLWSMAKPFYQRYVNAHLEGRSRLVWAAYLIVALLLCPPMIVDYARKL